MSKVFQLFLCLVFTTLLMAQTSHAVEVGVEKVQYHLADKLESWSNMGVGGTVETISAPEGKQFLSAQLHFVAKDWGKDEKTYRASSKEIYVQMGDNTYQQIGSSYRGAELRSSKITLYVSKPFGKRKQSGFRITPVFVVPKDFKEGKLKIGKDVTVDIVAEKAVPLNSPLDYADIKLESANFVDQLTGTKYLANKFVDTQVKPVQGKILKVSVDVSAKLHNNSSLTHFNMSRNDLFIESDGYIISSAGKSSSFYRSKFSTSSTSSFEVGENSNIVFYFVVPTKFKGGNIHYLGQKVADFKVSN